MERLVYLSNRDLETSEGFFQEAKKLVGNQREDSFYYILPNGKLINHYRDRFLDETGGSFSLNLFTFDDIVKKILDIDDSKLLEIELQYLIVSKILYRMNEEGSITYYNKFIKMEGFILSILEIIGSFKRDLIRSEDFLNKIPKNPYYLEIGNIYREYEAYLRKNQLYDKEEIYFQAIEKLKHEKLSLGVEYIFIDKFYDFRPIELKLIEILSGESLNMYINIDFVTGRENKILYQTISRLEELNFKISRNIYPRNKFENLAFDLFVEAEPIGFGKDLIVIEAATEYLEIKRVFEEIKLNYGRESDLSKIAITPLSPHYMKVIEKLSKEEKLPVNISFESSLDSFNISREILNILNLGMDKNFKSNCLNRINSGYFTVLEEGERAEIYTFIKNLDFKSSSDLFEILKSREFRIESNFLKLLLEFIGNLSIEIKPLRELNSLRGFNNYIRQILEKYNILEDIMEILGDDMLSFKLEVEKYKALISILDRMDDFSKYDEITDLEGYIKLLKLYLKNEIIKMNSANKKGIRVLNLIDNRGFEFESIYIVGLSRDNYPNIIDNNFFLQERNRGSLEKLGLNFKTYEENLDNEIIKLGELIGSTKSRLGLSYSKGENGEGVPSIFLDEIMRHIKNAEDLRETVSFDYLFKEDLERMTSSLDYKKYLLLNIYRPDIGKYYYELRRENLLKLNKRLRPIISRERGIDSYSGKLTREDIVLDLKETYENKKFSASLLERYGSCPFSFFMSDVLRLEEIYKEDLELDYLGLGNLYHKTLKEFYSEHYRDDISYLEVEKLVEAIFKKYAEDLEVHTATSLDSLILGEKYERLINFIKMDLELTKKEGLIPYKFEEDFGYREEFKIGDVSLVGRIDRVDRLGDSLVITDYKSSGSYGMEDMEKGLSLQMIIYILSQGLEKTVVARYGLINRGEYKLGIGLSGYLDYFKRVRKNKLETREEFEDFVNEVGEKIVTMKENIIQGDFSLVPNLCSDYCPYKDICRYEGR